MQEMMKTCVPDSADAEKLRWVFNLRKEKIKEWISTQSLEGFDITDVSIGPPFDTKYLKEHPEFKEGLVGVYRKKHSRNRT